ncbi:hypothetical protein AB1Y20_011178 [Prymnesium parvum]|uniref:Uncharacterized protein n=1 Tax=Prymnesium parvum TaxID=97485 RepID=A0AB34IMF1_PRYPA
MCIMLTPTAPSDTLLVLAPLEDEADGGVPRWQLCYVNSVAATPSEPVLMVVPLPNRFGMREADFIFSPLEAPQVAAIRRAREALFQPYASAPPFTPHSSSPFSGRSATFGAPPPPLAVQSIGSYKISVAPSLAELETRAPWAQLRVAPDRVDAILSGVRAAYPSGYAFAIARAESAVAECGFAVVYREVVPFLPTAHEALAAPMGLVAMDATLLAINAVLEPQSIGTHAQVAAAAATGGSVAEHPTYRVDDVGLRALPPRWGRLAELVRALPVQGGGVLHAGKLLRHAPPRAACEWRLRGTYRNADVRGHALRGAEERALREAFEQLDAWLTARALLGDANATLAPRGGAAGRPAVADFVLMLAARQLAMPGVADRISDAPRPLGAPDVPQAEIFLNLDVAAARGVDATIDLDSYAFLHKDAPQFAALRDGTSLRGTVYARISATPAPPHVLPMAARTVAAAVESEGAAPVLS